MAGVPKKRISSGTSKNTKKSVKKHVTKRVPKVDNTKELRAAQKLIERQQRDIAKLTKQLSSANRRLKIAKKSDTIKAAKKDAAKAKRAIKADVKQARSTARAASKLLKQLIKHYKGKVQPKSIGKAAKSVAKIKKQTKVVAAKVAPVSKPKKIPKKAAKKTAVKKAVPAKKAAPKVDKRTEGIYKPSAKQSRIIHNYFENNIEEPLDSLLVNQYWTGFVGTSVTLGYTKRLKELKYKLQGYKPARDLGVADALMVGNLEVMVYVNGVTGNWKYTREAEMRKQKIAYLTKEARKAGLKFTITEESEDEE